MSCNEPAGALLGIPAADLTGRNLSALFSPEAVKQLKCVRREGNPPLITLPYLSPGGETIYLESHSKEIRFLGQDAYFSAISEMSNRAQLDADRIQQDRLATLGLLASSLAHEIGTPLGVIRGRAELLESGFPDNATIKKNTRIIFSQVENISVVVRALMALAEGHGGASTSTEVDFHQVIKDVFALLSHEMKSRGIQVRMNVPEHTYVMAEPGPLRNIMLNLITNAIHAIESAKEIRPMGHWIEVSCQAEGGFLVTTLRDTGCGIRPDHLKLLFRPFFTTKAIGYGRGLGLAISYKWIDSWGGSLKVESTVGVGSVFSIALPMPQSASQLRA